MRNIEAQLIHDMTNAATVIRGAAETLHASARTMPPDAVEEITAMLTRRTDMLIRLLEDLATVHAIDRGDLGLQLQGVNLTETLRDVVADNRGRVAGTLSVDIDPDARVLADPMRLSQILDNLLSNAARYGGDNVRLRAWTDGPVVRISVSDDGAGVPPELVGSLFDLYSRGDTSRKLGGSGLGLAIVQQLCRVMGGSIEYDDRVGTAFIATLPAVPTSGSPSAEDARDGHTVSFWVDDPSLADTVADFTTNGLLRGEAVVLAITHPHRELIEERLVARGFDLVVAARVGQYLVLDATEVHAALVRQGHIDPERFEEIIGARVRTVDARWQTLRLFGEIVDLYWRTGRGHLALELEACWSRLRSEVDFSLCCGYEVSAGQDRVCDWHEAVLVA